MKKWWLSILAVFGLFGLWELQMWEVQFDREADPSVTHDPRGQRDGWRQGEPITPLTDPEALDARKVHLGELLFHDTRLSRDGTIACATCHDLERGGADGKPRSIGIDGAVGDINAPTVFNSAHNLAQFWDGRAATLEDQIDGPIHDPKEMGSNWADVRAQLTREPDYVQAFESLYRDGVTPTNIKDAIATFERSLITTRARFDAYLLGNDKALSSDEKKGYQLFKSFGCIACHHGANVGGNLFQFFGILGDYFADRGDITRADLGRFNVTGNDRDRYKFKVPSLRNVALTAPYFHDGSASTLEQAVIIMAKYQLGRTLTTDEVVLIVKFLNTLTGQYNGKPL